MAQKQKLMMYGDIYNQALSFVQSLQFTAESVWPTVRDIFILNVVLFTYF